MEVIIRHMEAHEAKTVREVGRHSFSVIEGLWVPKPKQALVAEVDGCIRGAIIYKLIKAGDNTIGYVDYAFVHKEFHNLGIGGKLYQESIAYLWSLGCDAVTAAVKDDNIGSFGLFEKNGLKRAGIADLIRGIGLGGFVKLYFLTPVCICVGMDSYLAVREGEYATGKGRTGREIGCYLLVNLLILCGVLMHGRSGGFLAYTGAVLLLLTGLVLVSYGATRLTKCKWRFRLTNGGILVHVLVSVMSFFPVIGGFYPERYENTDRFRRMVGIHTVIRWGFLLLVAAGSMLVPENLLFRNLKYISVQLLIYHILAFYPFEAFGGKRVFDWNKWVYACMVAASGILFFFV